MKIPKKTIGILVENHYQKLEVWYPLLRFKEAHAKVITIGSGSSDVYHSKLGYPVTADTRASAVSADDLDALIIPGGYAPDIMRTYSSIVNLVYEIFDHHINRCSNLSRRLDAGFC
jgi:protease I